MSAISSAAASTGPALTRSELIGLTFWVLDDSDIPDGYAEVDTDLIEAIRAVATRRGAAWWRAQVDRIAAQDASRRAAKCETATEQTGRLDAIEARENLAARVREVAIGRGRAWWRRQLKANKASKMSEMPDAALLAILAKEARRAARRSAAE